jgi:hypothetical protein
LISYAASWWEILQLVLILSVARVCHNECGFSMLYSMIVERVIVLIDGCRNEKVGVVGCENLFSAGMQNQEDWGLLLFL